MVFHLCVRNFLINAFYIEYLGCRCGNRSDACVSAGFSRATSERPHYEVIATRPDDWRTRSAAELRQVMGSTLMTA